MMNLVQVQSIHLFPVNQMEGKSFDWLSKEDKLCALDRSCHCAEGGKQTFLGGSSGLSACISVTSLIEAMKLLCAVLPWLLSVGELQANVKSLYPDSETTDVVKPQQVSGYQSNLQLRLPNYRPWSHSQVPNYQSWSDSQVPNYQSWLRSEVPNYKPWSHYQIPNYKPWSQHRVPNYQASLPSQVSRYQVWPQSPVPAHQYQVEFQDQAFQSSTVPQSQGTQRRPQTWRQVQNSQHKFPTRTQRQGSQRRLQIETRRQGSQDILQTQPQSRTWPSPRGRAFPIDNHQAWK
ncbi:unnamed protein product [Oreochromis niloticus]|nr:unnamed protein product [Mustela putorius furo]